MENSKEGFKGSWKEVCEAHRHVLPSPVYESQFMFAICEVVNCLSPALYVGFLEVQNGN